VQTLLIKTTTAFAITSDQAASRAVAPTSWMPTTMAYAITGRTAPAGARVTGTATARAIAAETETGNIGRLLRDELDENLLFGG